MIYEFDLSQTKFVTVYIIIAAQVAGSAATIAGQLEDLEMDELPMVKIGDVNVAAPSRVKYQAFEAVLTLSDRDVVR